VAGILSSSLAYSRRGYRESGTLRASEFSLQSAKKSLVAAASHLFRRRKSVMEDKVYAYLQQHQGLQSIDSVAGALECGVPAVLNASISLKNNGLIKMRYYPNGKYLEIDQSSQPHSDRFDLLN
jgi:hypothetical protein